MKELDKLRECFERIGIIVDDLDEVTELMDIIEESVTFITFIVELEDVFEIEIPDEYLLPGKLVLIEDVLQMIDILESGVKSNML